MFLMSQVKKSGQCQLRGKKYQYFSIVSLPADSVIVDHADFGIIKSLCETKSSVTIVYCYTCCTRQSIVEREGLEHDERNEECSKGTSFTTCLVKPV
jgi:hypothetical protein